LIFFINPNLLIVLKIMEWYLSCLKEHYADFKGRARRKEYWMFVLCNLLAAIVVAFVAGLIKLPVLYYLYGLAVLVPGVAVSVRRLHDIGKSGWWIFISLIPVIGGIWLLVLFCLDSQAGANEWGENPKA